MRSITAIPVLLAAALLPSAKAQQAGGPMSNPLIVIGFIGGKVSAGNLKRPEEREALKLQQRYPQQLRAAVYANRDGQSALETVLRMLDASGNGQPSAKEKSGARIVIFGHSWGASETVMLARRLNQLQIPVLLTIQIDSVQKRHEDDRDIPPNVRQAVNLYQTGGPVHGRKSIVAVDPKRTTILGNFEYTYDGRSVPPGYSWSARTLMRKHIEMDNDPSVWTRIEALIRAEVD
jgi:hypothetical protein